MAKKKSLKIQILQYFVGGGAFFWSGYVAFALFDGVLGWPLFIAKQLANLIGLTTNYIIQDRWAFKASSPRLKNERRRTIRYSVLTVVNFGIDFAIVAGLNEKGISPYIGQFVSAGFFTIWNFLWYKYWIFAHYPPKHKGARRKKK